jgi:tRNA threonylcarbamoyladenosine biosynthesis protein TsaB
VASRGGGYTGLRIGLATAHGLALSLRVPLVGVGTLRALAEPLGGQPVAAILDARRGEAFVAVYDGDRELLAPRVCDPAELAGLARRGGSGVLAVGDGALRFRSLLEEGGVAVAPAESERHSVNAAAICRLAARGSVVDAVPDYQRVPDAERADHTTTR